MHRGTSYLSIDRDDGGNVNVQCDPSNILLRGVGCLILGAAVLFLLSPPTNTHPGGVGGGLIQQTPEQVYQHAIDIDPRERTRKLPVRLQSLVAQSQVVGNHLAEVKEGRKSVEEIIHRGSTIATLGEDGSSNSVGIGSSVHIGAGAASRNYKSAPMTLTEIVDFLQSFLKKLNSSNIKNKRATYHVIWTAYHELAVKYLYPWDRDYMRRMPTRRDDGSLYVSVASFRDEFCPETLIQAFGNAKNPEKLFVGLVQQNCEEAKCRSGFIDGKMMDVKTDPDCYALFCSSSVGKKYCSSGNLRLLRMKESLALGPYMARYFAAKMWMGEQYYMQIDSHMTFLQDWDAMSIEMLKKAPSDKPVISHYPRPHTADLAARAANPAPRLCGPKFATSDVESEIVRLDGTGNYDTYRLDIPRFGPFVAAGYLVASAEILRDVPFDPFLPYIFMGEEIILSARLWTSGYDIFSPTHSVLGHHWAMLSKKYNKPKFWESLHRTFTFGIHDPVEMMVMNRIKYQLGYPESAKDMVKPKNLFTAVDQYSMGKVRPLEEYLKIVGVDVKTKVITYTAWCETGVPPPGFERYNHLYEK